ncbi:hypothetical protein C8R46DRAFT_1230591 [Mycena filopes]|nr:hypothetical protein C8R46DRAFT_1230591 [Mycena filopes]
MTTPTTIEELEELLDEQFDEYGVRIPEKWIRITPELFDGCSLRIDAQDCADNGDPLILDAWGDMPNELRAGLKDSMHAVYRANGAEGFYCRNSQQDKGREPFPVFHASTWARCGTNGKDAPPDSHPGFLDKDGQRMNYAQFVPIESKDISEHPEVYNGLCGVLKNLFTWMGEVLERRHPGKYKILEQMVEVLPQHARSPAHPFTGYVVNLNCICQIHRDGGDLVDFCGSPPADTVADQAHSREIQPQTPPHQPPHQPVQISTQTATHPETATLFR